jgi:hypothetical protein
MKPQRAGQNWLRRRAREVYGVVDRRRGVALLPFFTKGPVLSTGSERPGWYSIGKVLTTAHRSFAAGA